MPSGDLRRRRSEHRIGVHVMADVAHEHQAAARAGSSAPPVGRRVVAVGLEPALDRLAALLEAGREVPFISPSQLR